MLPIPPTPQTGYFYDKLHYTTRPQTMVTRYPTCAMLFCLRSKRVVLTKLTVGAQTHVFIIIINNKIYNIIIKLVF